MSEQTMPLRTYFIIISILMALTVLTVAVAFVDLGFLNIIVAITIAVVKAFLVVAFFMHLKYAARITWMFAGAGVVWFIIMIALLMSDYRTREWVKQPGSWRPVPAQTQHASAEPSHE